MIELEVTALQKWLGLDRLIRKLAKSPVVCPYAVTVCSWWWVLVDGRVWAIARIQVKRGGLVGLLCHCAMYGKEVGLRWRRVRRLLTGATFVTLRAAVLRLMRKMRFVCR